MGISDYHSHTTSSDGRDSMRAMAEKAAMLGLHQFGITDHSAEVRFDDRIIAFDRQKWDSYITEARMLQKEFPFLRIGLECDIKDDGTLDIPDFIKGGEQERFGLDYLIGSIHAHSFRGTRKELAGLFMHAVNEYPIDIIGHIFQPLLGIGEGFFTDDETSSLIGSILSARQEVAIELNGKPRPYNIPVENIERFGRYDIGFLHRCIEEGIRLTIGSDAHKKNIIGKYPVDMVSELKKYHGDSFLRADIPVRS